MSDELVTIAALLKNQGYATAQFGKNHLGDRNEHLPTKRRVLRQPLSPECRGRAGDV
jgi:arylsulfatase A-like enzyme